MGKKELDPGAQRPLVLESGAAAATAAAAPSWPLAAAATAAATAAAWSGTLTYCTIRPCEKKKPP